MTRITTTVLSDFGRTVRDEPLFLVYKHQLWLLDDKIPAAVVKAWLRKRYVEARKGHLYRVVEYVHTDGNRYVDSILLQTLTDKDMVHMKLMGWNFSDHKIKRGERVPRQKLTKENKAKFDALVAELRTKFFDEQRAAVEAKRAEADKAD
jgi:hypothetical protein